MFAARQVILAIAALVNTPSFTPRVYTSRRWPLASLPAARVYVSSEEVSVDSSDPDAIEQHDAEVTVDLYVTDSDGLDETMDAVAAEVLTSIMAAPPYQADLAGIDRQFTTDGEASVGLITLRLSAQFFVRASQPEVIVS